MDPINISIEITKYAAIEILVIFGNFHDLFRESNIEQNPV